VRAEVAVVIGNHQGEQLLGDCLESIASQTVPVSETLVVDGASTDASRSVAESHGVRFISFPNRGLGFLYNRGVEATSAAYVLLLNNDVALDMRCVELLAAELDADDTRFAADPTQFDWDGDRVIHARTTITRGRLLREYIPGLHLDSIVAADGVVSTVSAHGAAMLVRRSMFVELGGFDETFFMEWEDLDLCWRAWLRGWESVYVPDARLRHRVGAVTTTAAAPRRSASSHHNMMRFALKCLPRPAAARVLLGELLRLPAHPRAIGTAAVQVTRELPAILRLRQHQRHLGPLVVQVIDDRAPLPASEREPPTPSIG
jgi:GT2 family glycosyltransferase